MSFAYTEWVKPKIIEMVEEGTYSLRDIADACNVSIRFVEAIRNSYDMFYAGRW